MWLRDDAMNWSDLSNAATAQAGANFPDRITGSVRTAAGEGITGVLVEAYDSEGVIKASAYTLADTSGSYALQGLVYGFYRLQVSWSVSGIMSSVSMDSVPMGVAGINFDLEISYSLASISGYMQAMGAGRARYSVSSRSYAFNVDNGITPSSLSGGFAELHQNDRLIAGAVPDSTGRFVLPNLLPGKYSVRVYDGLAYSPFTSVNLVQGQNYELSYVNDPLPEKSVYAWPNPSSERVNIHFESGLNPVEKRVLVFDVSGALVRELNENSIESVSPGIYSAGWDTRNMKGQKVASGVYVFAVKVRCPINGQHGKVIKKLAIIR